MSSQNNGPSEKGKGKGALLGGAGILGLGLLKAKGLWLVLLKLLGSFKFLYLFKSFFSMFLMIGLYTMTFGWFYAFVVVGLILIHEMGHYIFMKGMGLNPTLPIFVPFMGAYVQMQNMPGDQASHAWVAIAGPLVGGVTSVALYFAGFMMHSPALMAAGNTGVLLNMLQLVPAKPLDGGFIVTALSKWFLLLGVGMTFTLFMMWHSPLLILICLVSCFTTWKAFTRVPEPDGRINGEVPASLPEKFLVGTAYFGLLGGLAFVYWLSHNELYTLVPPKF
jgi:Zn-dependent protease